MANHFTRRVSYVVIFTLALLGSIFYLYKVFYFEPVKSQARIKPEIEIHFGGPPMQEQEDK